MKSLQLFSGVLAGLKHGKLNKHNGKNCFGTSFEAARA
jgi:hypothetical protein